MEKNREYHVPVMLTECMEGLSIQKDGIYIDVTFGGGGHSKEIYDRLGSEGKLFSFDQDSDAQKNAWEAANFQFIASNFSHMQNHLKMYGIKQVDGILADLGVSSHQFDETERGFSIRGNARLDMRMNQKADLDAEKLVNTYSEEELLRVFRSYGEVPNARKLVNTLVAGRNNQTVSTTQDLLNIITPCAPKFKENRYFAQVFQAIRIEVNDEMEVLEQFLNQTIDLLKPGGRLVVMSYHSLEDRLIKNFMKRGSFDGKITKDFYGNVLKPFTEINRHPIIPQEEEIELNNRARSAKLRIAERNAE